MNKQDWTYKKLGEVATIVGGSTPKSNIEEYWGGTNYWVTPADLNGNKYQGATPRTITDLAVQKTNLQLLPTGTVLLSSRAPIGKVAITTVPMYCNQGFKNIICSNLLLNEFVYWYLLGKVDYLNSLGRGATFKEISKRTTEQIPIPVPPLAEQERIVAELDLLQGIIEKKKEQLKAYDQLAQSIFYSMFGDPIDNPKGWETKKLGEICENCDSMRKPITAKDREQGEIPYYGASGIVDYVKDYIFDGDYLLISEDGANLIARSTPIAFSIKGKTWVNNHAHVLKFTNQITQQYVEFSINLRDVSTIVTGCAQPKLTQANLNKIPISFPPLSLQQEFAEKVEAIERQKALVQQSIEEVQTMFDCTMDKYFG